MKLSIFEIGRSLLVTLLFVSPPAYAQSARERTIIDGEHAKEAHLTPSTAPHGEQVFDRVESHVLDRVFNPNGLSLALGGLPSGGGFSLGPSYERDDLLREKITSQSSIVGSTRKWYRAQSSLSTNRIVSERATFRLDAAYENAASFPYYGPGTNPASKLETNFRREFTTVHFTPLLHLADGTVTAGYQLGGLLVNVGPGDTGVSPSTERIFTEASTPGLTRQSQFMTGTALLDLDHTKNSFSNEQGVRFQAADTQFWDKSGNNHSFHLLQTQAIFIMPFMNGMRAFTIRAKNETTFHDNSQVLPFYLQPTLGGPDSLRGYDRYRYYGNGSSLISGEYRWSVAGTLEMAIFGDGGNLYSRPGLIGVRDLRADGGVGFRIKNKQNTVMRFDIGASPEGVQVWFVFNEAFSKLFRSY